MQYRRMGDAGIRLSAVSLGAWLTYGHAVEDAAAVSCLRTAIELGVNFIDIADAYAKGKAEEVVGRVIKDYKRTDLVISSKAFWPMSDNINDRGLSRKHLHESVEKTLKRLDTDYLDLFFCHRFDPDVTLEETVRALDDLVRAGKVLYWGTSMWSGSNLNGGVKVARQFNAYPPKVEQPRYNMLDRSIETDVLRAAREHGIGLVVWSPLAQGVLSGKYNNGIPADSRGVKDGKLTEWATKELQEENLPKLRALAEVAAELGVTMSQLALAWCLRLPEVTSVITGATRPEQVRDNVKAAELKLDGATLARLEEILANDPNAAA